MNPLSMNLGFLPRRCMRCVIENNYESRKPDTKMEHTYALPIEREGTPRTSGVVAQTADSWQGIPKVGIDIHQCIDLLFGATKTRSTKCSSCAKVIPKCFRVGTDQNGNSRSGALCRAFSDGALRRFKPGTAGRASGVIQSPSAAEAERLRALHRHDWKSCPSQEQSVMMDISRQNHQRLLGSQKACSAGCYGLAGLRGSSVLVRTITNVVPTAAIPTY